MINDRGPVVHQALLVHRLVALRRERGMRQAEVAKSMEWSHAKLMRYEGGSQVLPKADLDGLLKLYGVVDTPQGRELQSIGQKAREKPWWYPNRHVMQLGYRHFIGLEMGADKIRQYQTFLIPGLLQTREYAHAICVELAPEENVDRLVDIRMGRQGVVSTRNPIPEQTYILDEAVLKRRIGGRDITVRQLHRLMEAASSVDIHVVPEDTGYHRGLEGGFTLLDFDDDLPSIRYTEDRGECVVSEKEADVRASSDAFDNIVEKFALSVEDSIALIGKHIKNSESV